MKNGLGTAALVLGILAFIGSFIPALGVASIPMGILGIVLAILGLSRIKKGQANNKGASIAGLILSALAVIVAIIVTAVSALFLDAVNQGIEESGAAPVNPGTNEEAPEPQAEEQSEAGQFPGQQPNDVVVEAGESVTFAGATVTAEALEEQSDDIGGEYLCTVVSYVNDSDEQVSYNLLDWQLQNPEGNIKDSTFTAREDELSSGELAPGGKTSGEVCFEGSEDEAGQYVVLARGWISLSDDRAAWMNTF